jgi:hypothetical protein
VGALAMGSSTTVKATASCPQGETLVGGGGAVTDGHGATSASYVLVASYPSSASTWTVVGASVGDKARSPAATAYALCAA